MTIFAQKYFNTHLQVLILHFCVFSFLNNRKCEDYMHNSVVRLLPSSIIFLRYNFIKKGEKILGLLLCLSFLLFVKNTFHGVSSLRTCDPHFAQAKDLLFYQQKLTRIVFPAVLHRSFSSRQYLTRFCATDQNLPNTILIDDKTEYPFILLKSFHIFYLKKD